MLSCDGRLGYLPILMTLVCSAWCGATHPQDRSRDLRLQKQDRVALVIGNGNYPKERLKNPVNDARVVARSLAELGFEVIRVEDAGFPALERAIDRFTARLEPGGVALLFYAGHGIQLAGDNYLVPIDFEPKDEVDVKHLSYPVARLQDRMEASGARLSIIILDACRTNPFRAVRSASGGLAAMHAGRGTFIAFSTGPGKTADDNSSADNSLFTGSLVQALREPGLTLDQIFTRIRETVYAASGKQQLPWVSSSVIGDFYFRPLDAVSVKAPALSAPADLQADVAYWNSVKDSADPRLFEAYLNRFPNGTFSELAALRIEQLKAATGSSHQVRPVGQPQPSQSDIPSEWLAPIAIQRAVRARRRGEGYELVEPALRECYDSTTLALIRRLRGLVQFSADYNSFSEILMIIVDKDSGRRLFAHRMLRVGIKDGTATLTALSGAGDTATWEDARSKKRFRLNIAGDRITFTDETPDAPFSIRDSEGGAGIAEPSGGRFFVRHHHGRIGGGSCRGWLTVKPGVIEYRSEAGGDSFDVLVGDVDHVCEGKDVSFFNWGWGLRFNLKGGRAYSLHPSPPSEDSTKELRKALLEVFFGQ